MELVKGDIQQKIKELKPWFHNIHLPGNIQTAPEHYLGDFPAFKWQDIQSAVPENLSGWKVLDIGCNAGFYTFALADRGADVLGIDVDPHYLKQAKWIAEVKEVTHKTSFRQMQIYDLAKSNEKFDLVWFMGLLYHLRYPMLAMDIAAQVTKKMMVFQTLMMPGSEEYRPKEDYNINDREDLLRSGWPKMSFIEKKFAGDPTNWWVPNHAGIKAMMRSCGLNVTATPADEIYICEPRKKSPLSPEEWNRSEFLSATGQSWTKEVGKKVGEK